MSLKPCPFDNQNCMCQFCEDPCNNGLTCSDCDYEGRAVHDIWLCTGFKGDINEYAKNWALREIKKQEVQNEQQL